MGKEKDAVLIRDFQKSDLNDLLDLLPRCFTKEFELTGFDSAHARGMVNRGYGITGRVFMATARLFGREPIKFLVAEAKNEVVGTTMVNCEGKVCYVSMVMVHPDYRRKGIATTLVKSAVAYAQKRGFERVILHADSTNAPAVGTYSKLGFTPFEHVAYFVGGTGSVPAQGGGHEVETRPFRGDDLDEVYNLVRASEDPNHLRIYDFSKGDLKTPFWLRLVGFETQKNMVAVREGKIVGYVQATYTTPKEAGRIGSIQVHPEDRSRGIERMLIDSAIGEIGKGGAGRALVGAPTTRQELVETLNDLGFRETMVLVGMSRETRS